MDGIAAGMGCPTCRGLYSGTMTGCPTCGRHLRERLGILPIRLVRIVAGRVRRHPVHRLALIPAAVPILLPFPILALVLAASGLRRLGPAWRSGVPDWGPVACVAVLNVILSVWALNRLAAALIDPVLLWWTVPMPVPGIVAAAISTTILPIS